MRFSAIMRLAFIGAALLLIQFPHSSEASFHSDIGLSSPDRKEAIAASHLAAQNPLTALHWLRGQTGVARATLGPDLQTIDIQFGDGGELVILPRRIYSSSHVVPARRPPLYAPFGVARQQVASGRAVILEPFNDEVGPDAGASEATALSRAGFKVDIFRGTQVTVSVLESLNRYSVVFMETHSGPLPNGDAIVDIREKDITKYPMLRETRAGGDGSLVQALAAGESEIFIAFTTKFVSSHLENFPSSSIVFINGCDLDGATALWSAFHDKGVAATISWQKEVYLSAAVPAAEALFMQMLAGKSVTASLDATNALGLGTSLSANGGTAKLEFKYDGSDTFARALAGVVPTPAPTNTPTATSTPGTTATPTTAPPTDTPVPLPLFIRAKLAHKSIKVGEKQTITIHTLPGATVLFKIAYPSGKKATHKDIADTQGVVKWTFKQPQGTTRGSHRNAHVTVKASQSSVAVVAVRTYRIL